MLPLVSLGNILISPVIQALATSKLLPLPGLGRSGRLRCSMGLVVLFWDGRVLRGLEGPRGCKHCATGLASWGGGT